VEIASCDENPIDNDLPAIKKIINSELFIDRKEGLYIQTGDKERIKKLSTLIEEGKLKPAGMRTLRLHVWIDLHYMGGMTN